jgi:hypothetical protein
LRNSGLQGLNVPCPCPFKCSVLWLALPMQAQMVLLVPMWWVEGWLGWGCIPASHGRNAPCPMPLKCPMLEWPAPPMQAQTGCSCLTGWWRVTLLLLLRGEGGVKRRNENAQRHRQFLAQAKTPKLN